MKAIMITVEDFSKKIEEWVAVHIGVNHTYNDVKAAIQNLHNRFVENQVSPVEVAKPEVVVEEVKAEENAPAPVPEYQDNITNEAESQPVVEQA